MRAVAADATAYAQPNPRGKDGNAVNKYAALSLHGPLNYVDVAPDVRRVYRLTFVDRDDAPRPAIEFEPADEVPAGP